LQIGLKKKNEFIFFILSIIGAFALPLFFNWVELAFKGTAHPSPNAFSLGVIKIRWYALIIVSAIIVGYLITIGQAKKEGANEDDIISNLSLGIIFGVIGARLYYVLFNLSYYLANPIEILMTRHGGLAIHGAIIGAILSLFLFTRLKKNCSYGFWQAMDWFAIAVPLGQAMGRWGNFMNQEAFGTPTNLPWKMYIEKSHRPIQYLHYEYFHPTFLYESVWDIATFVIVYTYVKKYRKNFGEGVSLYFILYSIGRFFVEGLRTDSLYMGKLRTAQVMSLFLIGLGAFGLFFFRSRNTEKV